MITAYLKAKGKIVQRQKLEQYYLKLTLLILFADGVILYCCVVERKVLTSNYDILMQI